MRALAIFVGLLATLGAGYVAYGAARAIGPDDRSNEFGFGDAALSPEGGGTLTQSKNFTRVVQALERELGADGTISYLRVELSEATATGRKGNQEFSIQVDASGRSRALPSGARPSLAALIPVAKIDPAAVDKVVKAAREETGSPVESLTLSANGREWRADMLRGEPDSFIANFDGSGLRISGEPNPVPQGAAEDSMFRAKNLQAVLDAAAEEGADELIELSIWPERVSIGFVEGRRAVSLQYSYDAILYSRDVSALTGAPEEPVALSAIKPAAIARMARHRQVKGLENVMYVLLQQPDVFSDKPALLMYLPQGSDPPYITADLDGRRISWPGRS
jgi:hypothetical protein